MSTSKRLNIRDKGARLYGKGKAAIKSLSRSKIRPSNSQASSARGTLSFTNPSVSPSEGNVNTGATKRSTTNINLTETPSASATEAIGTRGSTSLAPVPAPPVAGTLEILDPVGVLLPLGQPGA